MKKKTYDATRTGQVLQTMSVFALSQKTNYLFYHFLNQSKKKKISEIDCLRYLDQMFALSTCCP